MSVELKYLTWAAVFHALMWVPYILNTIAVRGMADAVGYPENPKPLSPWAERMKKAHYNSVENLVVFAALVLVANAVGISTNATAMACMVYFWARVAHFVVYTLGLPWLRTLSFAVAWAALMTLAWQLLA